MALKVKPPQLHYYDIHTNQATNQRTHTHTHTNKQTNKQTSIEHLSQ
jgi:hypothetical protein